MRLVLDTFAAWRRAKVSADAVRMLTGYYGLLYSPSMSDTCIRMAGPRGDATAHQVALIYLIFHVPKLPAATAHEVLRRAEQRCRTDPVPVDFLDQLRATIGIRMNGCTVRCRGPRSDCA